MGGGRETEHVMAISTNVYHQFQVDDDSFSKKTTSVHKVLPFPRHVTFLI